ncbi:molybdenum cofactor sulfurase [Aristolochia californica]|uniref:molybdenum cofactor sulfurase n=1 Tax=Aristolochia californica TaxID=171875 RepID=UPI0035E19CCB
MQSPCLSEATRACFHGCCTTSLLSLTEPPKPKAPTTSAASRSKFVISTASSIFPDTQFTNHESLPSLPEAFSNFTEAYPQYSETEQADRIRTDEFYHLMLSDQVCLDYIGFGLFSHSQHQTSLATASSSSPPRQSHSMLQSCFFDISYKAVSLNSQILYGTQETPLESAIRKRITAFLNISEQEYGMVCTANTASAFKLLAESYPFQTNRRLLTVYDYENEAVNGMIEISQKRGARAASASFSWPSLRINSSKLRKMVTGKRNKKKKGLFVFPLQSRMTGSRYSYLWMTLAQEQGWHVLLDACALGPKDMDTLGLSLFKPDFLICSFFKVFGENPSGFGCLFVKRSSSSTVEASTVARSIGIVSIIPAKQFSNLPEDSSGTDYESQNLKTKLPDESRVVTGIFSGPVSARTSDGQCRSLGSSKRQSEVGETSELSSEIVELEKPDAVQTGKVPINSGETDESFKIECRGLDHADSLGLNHINCRVRFLVNWLVLALLKLRHPHSETGHPLVKIYGPKIKFNRGPAVAFNVFDWKGEKIEPSLVQKLADRSNISLSYGFLQNIWFSEKYEQEKQKVLENRTNKSVIPGSKKGGKYATGITVVTAAIGFLANFEDAYRLWAFVAKFLDADFVEKERWRYVALNQKTIEV